MKWTIIPNEDKKFITVTTNGELQKEDLNGMLADIIKNATIHKIMNIIIDHRMATFSISMVDTFERPYHFQESGVPRTVKIALVFTNSEDSEYKFFETIFVNRGFQVKIFDNLADAENWIY